MANRDRCTDIEGIKDSDEENHWKSKIIIIRYRCKMYVVYSDWWIIKSLLE